MPTPPAQASRPDLRRVLHRKAAGGLAIFGLMAVFHAADAQERMYRYTDAEGNKVVAYQVPPEHVAGGYEILNGAGTLIDVVRPQIGDGAEDMQARREREAEEERLRAWDESLLLRYSSLEDIEAARDRALRDLHIRVSILTSKLTSLKGQVENYQALAADQERRGQEVDRAYIDGVADLRSEIAATERAIDDRHVEIAEVSTSFERDLERFATLLDMVELRRAQSAGS